MGRSPPTAPPSAGRWSGALPRRTSSDAGAIGIPTSARSRPARRDRREHEDRSGPSDVRVGALATKRRGVPVILDLHDLMPEFFAGRFGAGRRPILARAIRWQERAACRFADHVITVSDPWRRSLIARGVAPERCSVVLNVADP